MGFLAGLVSLVVPHPSAGLDLKSAGMNGNGEFIVSGNDSQVVRVGDEWRTPLAAHLLAPTRIFDPTATATLRGLIAKAGKKRGGRVTEEEASVLGALADALEALMEHYLDADPKTSRRIEWKPELYGERKKRYVAARGGDASVHALTVPPLEEEDDTPMPWEK